MENKVQQKLQPNNGENNITRDFEDERTSMKQRYVIPLRIF